MRVVAVFLILLFTSGVLAFARADITLDAAAGFDNVFRPEAWNPMTVTVSGTGVNSSAELQLVVTSPMGSATYTKSIRLHAGPLNERHTITYYHPTSMGPPTIVVQLVADGRKLAEKKVEKLFNLSETQPAIVALTQDRSGLNYLQKVDLGHKHNGGAANRWNQFGGFNNGGNQLPNPIRVLYPAASGLPESAGGYGPIDIVMLGDLALDSLTEDQWTALVRWVKDGGELVVSGGSDFNRIRAPQFVDLLPITPTGARQVKSLPALGERYDQPLKIASTGVIAGTLKPDSTSFCKQGELPLVSSRRVGTGVVIFTAFDLTAPEMRAWPGQTALWQEILNAGAGDISARQVLKNTSQSWGWGTYRMLADALAGVQGTDAPSFTSIGLFLGLYIFLLVPVNYFVLRRFGRKELAWLSMPLIVIVFTTGAYAIGYSIKGGTLFLRFGSVIEGAANSDGWSAYTLATIFSPRQTRYDLSVADASALVAEQSLEPGSFRRQTADLTIARDSKTTVKDALVNMWDHRNFGFESHLELGGTVSASVLPTGGRFNVHLTNNTRYTLTSTGISYRGQSAQTGTLAPGQSADVHLGQPQVNVVGRLGPIPAAGSIYSPNSAGRIQQALAGSLTSNEGGVEGNDPMLFTGWFSDPVVGLALAHENPRLEGINLLAVHLPVPSASSGGAAPDFRRVQNRVDPFSRQGFRIAPPTGGVMSGLGAGSASQQGNVLYARGNYQGAETLFRQAIRQNPSDAQSYNMLAYALAGQKRHAEAVTAAHNALKLSPADGNILDSVAEMHMKLKEYGTAETYFRQALARQGRGGQTETHEKFGETLIARNKKSEAITHLQIAARAKGDPWAAKAQQKLKSLGVTVPALPSYRGAPRIGGPGMGAFRSTPRIAPRQPIPTTGKGSRRSVTPLPNGAQMVTDESWDYTNGHRFYKSRSYTVGPTTSVKP